MLLIYFSPNFKIIVASNASNWGLKAGIFHISQDVYPKDIDYASEKNSQTE